MRFPVLPALLLIALAAGGCASQEKRAQRQIAKMEQDRRQHNSRVIEEGRVREMAGGYAGSKRGAEIIVLDPDKEFNLKQLNNGGSRTFTADGKAGTKEFYFDQKTRPLAFNTRDYAGSKANTAADRKFATNGAGVSGKFEIPNADKKASTGTSSTSEAREANKIAASRDLWDGKRPYLGRESNKLNQAIDAKDLANWRQGGGETVVYGGGTVDRIGTIKQLSIDEVRELLNKNK